MKSYEIIPSTVADDAGLPNRSCAAASCSCQRSAAKSFEIFPAAETTDTYNGILAGHVLADHEQAPPIEHDGWWRFVHELDRMPSDDDPYWNHLVVRSGPTHRKSL